MGADDEGEEDPLAERGEDRISGRELERSDDR
jgi:hypothetical protein